MKISFIIPAFNEEEAIGRCVESILRQTDLNDFEIIVVDNGSTDKTAEVAKNFPNTKVISYTAAKGPAAARNEGARRASGEFLAFFDADVLVPRDWTKKMLQIAERNPKLIAFSGCYHYIGFGVLQKTGEVFFRFFIAHSISRIFELLKIGTVIMGGDFVVKKWAFDKIGGFESKIKFYGDEANLSRRLIKLGPIRYYTRLWVDTSARRFLKEGFFKTQWIYTKNFFSELLFHKVATEEYHDVR